ncbi:beta-ketoacyl synthase chain length factor [Mucilaginibacter sp. L3T2-6]|uniref:beta-ketoacyl synthase chain length factor n=1 Tax=Mucilaginibacter sp. L3T2-6 TaxID=3062491 RepID=UPI0026763EC2|nr:beta-ketoacyl synthase chain length factor [Mucilaginibacter sp. L3T2-6]MDO3640838.1 beta-ketoacyl synthase chain length factor [Mucilaginibacter sp. L3T2-6]MDV6213686.1 beta-ketoacyl synthase chain length factor [Mucilaginibacter sp. L3T2-6]
MKVYIRSSACISAQRTFGTGDILTDIVEYNSTRLPAIEPDYKEFIDPKQIRRMSHVIKMGVAAAKECLNNGDVEMPGAIITGTAFGCMEDTVTFLTRIIEQEEELLPPTAFIQSTHNTVAAQVALMLKCHAYNSTFVHKGISFESALFDAVMLLQEQEADNILVGGTEEMVDTSFTVLTRLGFYRRKPVSNLSLFATPEKGTIGGEGAGFFLLTDKESPDNLAELTGLTTFYKPTDNQDIERRITAFLQKHSLTVKDIDLVITGKNGDIKNDEIYAWLNASLFKNNVTANYKHLSGEYSVASVFSLWLAANIVKKGIVPDAILEDDVKINAPKKVLLLNHYQNKYYSLMLVSAV